MADLDLSYKPVSNAEYEVAFEIKLFYLLGVALAMIVGFVFLLKQCSILCMKSYYSVFIFAIVAECKGQIEPSCTLHWPTFITWYMI